MFSVIINLFSRKEAAFEKLFSETGDANVDEIALLAVAFKVNLIVNIGRISSGASDTVSTVAASAKYLYDAAYAACVVLIQNMLLQTAQHIGALICGVLIAAVGHFAGGSTFFGGIGENACTFDFSLPKELTKLLKFCLALAGVTDNKAGADNKTGDAFPELFEKLSIALAAAAAVHAAEHFGVDMLDGDIQIFDNFGVGCNLVNKLIVYLVGVEIVETEPLYALNVAELPAKLGKAALAVKVSAIAGQILSDKDKLFNADFGQRGGLGDDVLHRAGTEGAPDIGDGAVVAAIVAAFRNFYVCPFGACSKEASNLINGAVLIAKAVGILAFEDGFNNFNNILIKMLKYIDKTMRRIR